MNKTLKFLAKLSVSVGFLAYIIYRTDWTQVLFYVQEIAIWKLLIYVALIVGGIAVSAHKWGILAKHKNLHNNFGDYYRYYLTGTFINNFMPSFIGGDTFRAYEIGKPEKKYIEAASSVMADRITGFIGMTILALLFSLLNIRQTMHNSLLIIIDCILVLSLLTDVIVAKTRNWKIWKKLMNRIPQKIAKFIIEVQDYSNSPKVITEAIVLGIIFQFVGVAVSNFILFWALNIKIGLLDYFSVVFLISLITSVPISINNIGIKEWAYVTFFGIYGLDGSAVVTVSILSRIIQMFISFFALPTYLRSRK